MLFIKFWNTAPALLYALVVLIASSAAFSGNLILLIPAVFILFPLVPDWKRLLILLILGGSAFGFVNSAYDFPEVPKEGIRGTGYFEISSLSSRRTPYGMQWVYQGKLRYFHGYQIIPCTISISEKEWPANQSYKVTGTLKKSKKGSYFFVTDKKIAWLPVKGSWSLAEMRFNAKQTVSKYIIDHIPNRRAADFLAGLATGNFEDPLMFNEFARFGLQHIMAISGFHFAIIASILGIILRLIIPEKYSTPLLIFLLSSYFFFLGDSPSIIRAWITILVALVGITLEKRVFGLNSLGAAILFIVIYSPLMCSSVGFQFSVLSTAAILLFYPIFDRLLTMKRSLSDMVEMDWFDQHGYAILTTFRQALALGLAVNIVAIPAMLFYFQKFPYLSLLFNLFFPFLVSISMLLLIVGLILGPLGGIVHLVNSYYTDFALNFLYGMPTSFDYILKIKSFPAEVLVVYLTLVFAGGIYAHMKLKDQAAL